LIREFKSKFPGIAQQELAEKESRPLITMKNKTIIAEKIYIFKNISVK